MAKIEGVYPIYKNQFQVGKSKTELTDIADMESFSVSFDDGVEEWNAFSEEGWGRRMKTSKKITISVTGKRNVGDPGNDFVAGLAFLNGRDSEGCLQWTFPDGTKVILDGAVFNIGTIGAGDSTGVAPLEFEVLSNGKPEVVPAI